ncbi:MAG: serine/threonine protein kinase [Verrucomicrobia bacterium]|nr:serine/threonine protein kinase [Verrucomicrobiota bacterium]
MDNLVAAGVAAAAARAADPPLASGAAPKRFGSYEIQTELGRGGMGVVYRARQLRLHRDVALKVILAGQLASPREVRRFRTEAEAAGRLDHPNIVTIYEVGEHDGRHFFSMKLVEGPSLAERISGSGRRGEAQSSRSEIRNPKSEAERPHAGCYTPKEAARLLATLARAVHYAHERGVLHRDLKPSNILLDSEGQPHLTDFGLAKLLGSDSNLTLSSMAMGSPNYMAPELAQGRAREATTAVDIYSLGAILFELLAGRPPFQAETVAATLRQVTAVEALPPSRFNPAVSRDLDTVALKCLEKQPARRYRSALELAEDLERFLRGEPIAARPANRAERFRRWCQRQPALAGSLAALLLVFLFGFCGVLWKWSGEVRQRRLAQQESRRAQQAVTRLEIERAESLLQAGDSSRGLAYLARLLRQQPTNYVVAERLLSALTYRSFCVPVSRLPHDKSLDSLSGKRKEDLANWFEFRFPGSPVAVNFSRDGKRLVTASRDGTARLWDASNGQPLGQPMKHDAEVVWAQFSGDGRHVVTASADDAARIWHADTTQLAAPPLRHEGFVAFATFSRDDQKVITASQDQTARIWDARTGHPIGLPLVHPAPVYFACFSPDGARLLTADDGEERDTVRLWDAKSGKEIAAGDHFHFATDPMRFPQFSPSSEQVVAPLWHLAFLLNVRSNLARSATLLHDSFCLGGTYSPDGRRVATVSSDTTARLWDTATGEMALPPLRHDEKVSMADFTADGQQLLTASHDKSARLWEVRTGKPLAEPLRQEHAILAAKVSADGRRVATISETDTAWLWEVRPLQPLAILRRLPLIPLYARFSKDGEHLLVVDESDVARVWNAKTGAFESGVMQHAVNTMIFDAQFYPDGRRLLTSSEIGTLQVWDAATGAPIGALWKQSASADRVRFSPDGRRVATTSRDSVALLRDAGTGQPIFELRHASQVYGAEFSPDGSLVITASKDGTARIWDVATGRPVGAPLPHDSEVFHAEFDRAARRVLTASKDKTVRLWSVQTGQMLLPPLVHADALNQEYSATFSPEDSRLATAAGGVVQIWDSNTGRPVTSPLRHGGKVRRTQFSPDGRKLLTASGDGMVRLWDPETGHALSEPLRHSGRVSYAEFSPDGTRVVTCAADMAVRIWEVTSAPVPVPEWLPELAEAIAGQRLDDQEVCAVVSVAELYRLRQKRSANLEQTSYGRWARWFFQDSASRAISPLSETTVPEYVRRRIEDDTRESLQEATLLSATNALAFARLADHLIAPRRTGPHLARAVPEDADWFSRYATNLAPHDPEVLASRQSVIEKLRESSALAKP